MKTLWVSLTLFLSITTSTAVGQPQVASTVEIKTECLEASDPRARIAVAGKASAPGGLVSVSMEDAEVTVMCAPDPPPPGSIVSDGRLAVQIRATMSPKTKTVSGGAPSLAVSSTIDLWSYARKCSLGGHPPFKSVDVSWKVVAKDKAGAMGRAAGSYSARCRDGTAACLDRPVKTRPACGASRCACGLVCCAYVPDPDSRCVSHALCEKLRRLQERERGRE
jgi:hypothetical protein